MVCSVNKPIILSVLLIVVMLSFAAPSTSPKMRKEFGRNFEKVATIWRSQKFSKCAESSQDVEGQFKNPFTVVTIFWLLQLSHCASIGSWTQTLDLEMVWQVFYHCRPIRAVIYYCSNQSSLFLKIPSSGNQKILNYSHKLLLKKAQAANMIRNLQL
jgi:hypothetical protein